jgi:uncharacterized protein (TIGR00255 family)
MILSMTGYGMGSAQKDAVSVAVEIRAVNHRFLDLHIRIPREYLFLEGDIQKQVRKMLDRGRVEINVAIQHTGATEFLVNESLARGYMNAAEKLRGEFDFGDSLDLRTILSLPGIIQTRDALSAETAGALSGLAGESVQAALEGVLKMRRAEGESLRTDMAKNLDVIEENVARIQSLSFTAAADSLEKLRDRISQLIPQGGLDPQRLAQEAALIADKSDISEEVARLKSHIGQYRSLMDAEEKAGKKLDFLLQEFQREANTILSKSGGLEIARLAIEIKTDIEKLREQVQNVE